MGRCCTDLNNKTMARAIYIRCINGIFGREFTKDTVIYGVYTLLANVNQDDFLDWDQGAAAQATLVVAKQIKVF